MRINRNYEKSVNLRDLFFHVLYRWRRILAATVCMSLLFAGIQMIMNKVYDGNADKKGTKALEEFNVEKLILEQNMERWAQGRDTSKAYLDHSLYMKLDAMNIHYAVKHYLVMMAEGTSDADTENVLKIYGYVMEQEYDPQELENVFGESGMVYIREIAKVEIDKSLKQINISVMAADDEGAKKGCGFLGEKLEALESQAQKVAKHTLSLVSEGAYTNAEPAVLSYQQDAIASYNTYNSNYEYTVKDYHALEAPRVMSSIKNRLILGALIGLVGSVLALAGTYLIGNRLHSGKEVADQYEVPVFGEMKQSRAWRKGKGIDKLIEKWEFHADHRTEESVYQNMVALIREQKEKMNITLVSTLKEQEVKTVQEKLKPLLEGKEILLAPDFLANSESISMVTAADAVLLLEKKYSSQHKDIFQMVGMLQISNANVVGAVIL